VGAGDGTLLDALSKCGRDAVGLERHAAHPEVREAEVIEIEGEWAAIVFWHSLEHVSSPGAAIDHAVSILAPHGLLAVAVPNIASLQARLFGDRWLALDLPRHRVHLTTGALLRRLRALGLRIERVSYVRGGQVVFGWLHGLVALLPSHPDLYDALRRSEARRTRMSPGARAVALGAGVLLLPLAVVGAAAEVALRRGGTVYVEARRV
jgi:hypothetical protein